MRLSTEQQQREAVYEHDIAAATREFQSRGNGFKHDHTNVRPVSLFNDKRFYGSGGSSATPAFTTTIKTITVSGTPTDFAALVIGCCNQVLPSNIFNSDGLSDGLPYFALASGGINYVKLVGVASGGYVTSCTIVVDANDVNEGDNTGNGSPPTGFEILLAVITGSVQGSRIAYQVNSGNILMTPQVAFIQSATPASQGAEPFVRWWRWVPTFVT